MSDNHSPANNSTPHNDELSPAWIDHILTTGSHKECIQALRKLESTSPDEEIIKALLQHFSHRYWRIRGEISHLLLCFGEDVVEPIGALLGPEDEDTCYWGLRTLSYFPRRAIPVFQQFIKDENSEIRYYCVLNLRNVGTKEAISLLVDSLQDPAYYVREQAALSLKEIGQPAVPYLTKSYRSKHPDVKYWSMRLLGQLLGKEAMPIIKKALRSSDINATYYALIILSEILDEENVPYVVKALGHKAWIVRKQAQEVLIKKGKEVIPHLLSAFVNETSDVRYTIIKLLARIMEHEAVAYFQNMLIEEEDDEMRYYAVSALGEIKHPNSVQILIDSFTDSSWAVRKEAADQLVNMGDFALPFVEEALNNSNPEVFFGAIRVLARMGEPGLGPLIDLISSGSKRIKQFIIARITPVYHPDLVTILIDCFNDDHWPIRAAAARFLENIGKAVIEPLCDALSQDNENIRYWVRRVLASYEALPEEDETKPLAQAPASEKTEEIEQPAEVSEMEMKVLAALDEIQASKDMAGFKEVLREFVQIKKAESVEVLLTCLDHDNADISACAALVAREHRDLLHEALF